MKTTHETHSENLATVIQIPNAAGRIPDAMVRKSLTVRISKTAFLGLTSAGRHLNARPGLLLNMFAEAIGKLPPHAVPRALLELQSSGSRPRA